MYNIYNKKVIHVRDNKVLTYLLTYLLTFKHVLVGVENWFPLRPHMKDEEVQGELRLQMGQYSLRDRRWIHVKVMQAR